MKRIIKIILLLYGTFCFHESQSKNICGIAIPYAIESGQRWFLFPLYKENETKRLFTAFTKCRKESSNAKWLAADALTEGTYNQYSFTKDTLPVKYWKQINQNQDEYYWHIVELDKKIPGSNLFKAKKSTGNVVDFVWFTEQELKQGNSKQFGGKNYIIDNNIRDFILKYFQESGVSIPSTTPITTAGGWYELDNKAIYFDRDYDHLLAKGRYFWLTNFDDATITLGRVWPDLQNNPVTVANTEIYFQAQKFMGTRQDWADDIMRMKRADDAFQFVKKGRKDAQRRSDWQKVNIPIMLDITRAKYFQNPDLAEKLRNTQDTILVEQTQGRSVPDEFWGAGEGQGFGHNMLGQVIMHVRNELQQNRLLDFTGYQRTDWIKVNINKQAPQQPPLIVVPAHTLPYPKAITPPGKPSIPISKKPTTPPGRPLYVPISDVSKSLEDLVTILDALAKSFT